MIVKINKNFTEVDFYENKFKVAILDTNFNELSMRTKGRGQRYLNYDTSKFQNVKHPKFQIKVGNKYIKLKKTLKTVYMFGNSIAWNDYYFKNNKYYIRISYWDSTQRYYSDIIPIFIIKEKIKTPNITQMKKKYGQ